MNNWTPLNARIIRPVSLMPLRAAGACNAGGDPAFERRARQLTAKGTSSDGPLTHRKLQRAVWMESPVVYYEDGWPLFGSIPFDSQISGILEFHGFRKKLASRHVRHSARHRLSLKKQRRWLSRFPIKSET